MRGSEHDPDRRSLLRDTLPAAAAAAVAATAATQASAQTPTNALGADPGYLVPGLHLAFTAYVQIGAMRNIGEIPGGQGRIIPITGGEFEGPRLKGVVMPGGADWQTVRPDGVTELRAHYGLETNDGAIIQVWNNVLARADPPAETGGAPQRFLRSTIRLEAPKGVHDWLNKAVFVGTLNAPGSTRSPVTIRAFEVI